MPRIRMFNFCSAMSARALNASKGLWLLSSAAWPGVATPTNHRLTGFTILLFGSVAGLRDLGSRRALRSEA